MASDKVKRRTWRDRPRPSMRYEIDIVSKDGGRVILTGGEKAESHALHSLRTIVRTIAIFYGVDGARDSVEAGIREAVAALKEPRDA